MSGSSPCTLMICAYSPPSRSSAAAMRSVAEVNSPSGRTTRPPNDATWSAMRSSSVATYTAEARAQRTARWWTRWISERPAIIASGLPGKRVEAHRAGITIAAFMRDQVRRLTIVAAAAVIITFSLSRLWLLYAHKFYDVTGSAQWIWAQHQLSRDIPVAFFATREFDLPANRYFTRVKIAGDPEYTLWFNGTEIGGGRTADARALDVYDVTPLARTSANRMVIGVRSQDGVGGIIASIDVAPEVRNVVVTDSKWHIVRRWIDDLMVHDPEPAAMTRPMLL